MHWLHLRTLILYTQSPRHVIVLLEVMALFSFPWIDRCLHSTKREHFAPGNEYWRLPSSNSLLQIYKTWWKEYKKMTQSLPNIRASPINLKTSPYYCNESSYLSFGLLENSWKLLPSKGTLCQSVVVMAGFFGSSWTNSWVVSPPPASPLAKALNN